MLFRFFQFLIYVYLNGVFVQYSMKKLSFFNANFQNSFQDVLHNNRVLNLMMLTWRPFKFEYGVKFEKQ